MSQGTKNEVHDALPATVIPVRKVTPEVVEEVAPLQRAVPSPVKTVEEYKARIAEIKRTVNAQVGNPIVLMDGQNAIGREYMTALLSAMKAVAGTAPGTLQSSMDTLEKVFIRITALPHAKEGETTTGTKESVVDQEVKRVVGEEKGLPADVVSSKQESVPQVPSVTEPASRAAEKIMPLPSVQRKEMPPVTKTVRPQEKSPIPALTDLTNERVNVDVVSEEKPRAAAVSEPIVKKDVTAVPPPTPLRRSSAPIPSVIMREEVQKHVPEQSGGTSPAIKDGGKHTAKGVGRSGFDVTQEGDMDHPVPAGVSDDLHAPEIEEGLKQLLSEWSIFRGGGLFGTGPAGMEHPLYKKLAPLPMAMVATGSWENASKEAILSIKDYINGWRHEQGVAYTSIESFDNYLRRVIKRILKRASGI